MACKKSEFKSNWPLVGPIEMQGLCTATATKSHACYSSDVCIPKQYIYRHILSMSTRYLAVDATPGGCTKYWNEIKNVVWFCSFCFKVIWLFVFFSEYFCENIAKTRWPIRNSFKCIITAFQTTKSNICLPCFLSQFITTFSNNKWKYMMFWKDDYGLYYLIHN